jgi:2-methylisocitrate lyase-like PEP mutase family enzyme
MMVSQDEKGQAFRALHEGEPFIVPNPWDAGSAKVFAGLGFEALATTSAGFAFTLGRRDGGVTLDELAAHVHVINEATELPVSVDLENGFGPAPEDAARAITTAAGAGAVGGSIEDWDAERGLYEPDHATERITAASEAARGLGFQFMLTARAENFFRGNPDLDDTIARLQAYERAGADVLYAPALESVEQIKAVCDAVTKPVNVLARRRLSMTDIVAAGAQRVSVGSWLTMVAVDAVVEAATKMRHEGDFSLLRAPAQINEWLDA